MEEVSKAVKQRYQEYAYMKVGEASNLRVPDLKL